MVEDTLLPFALPSVQRKKVTAAFDGGRMTSDGGDRLQVMPPAIAQAPVDDPRIAAARKEFLRQSDIWKNNNFYSDPPNLKVMLAEAVRTAAA
jgi:hypothetical protein